LIAMAHSYTYYLINMIYLRLIIFL